MKRLLLVGTASVGLAASGSVAHATPFDFTYTGSLVDFTVPTTDTYQILAFGAQGGSGGLLPGFRGAGGSGAEIGGDFALTAGEMLQIAVGGAGIGGMAGGGGGGSFVVGPGNMPLVIAGGGGGGGAIFSVPRPAKAVLPAPTAAAAPALGLMAALTATVVALAEQPSPAAAVAGFAAPAVASSAPPIRSAQAAAVHFRISRGVSPAVGSAAAVVLVLSAPEAAAATAVAVLVLVAYATLLLPAVAAAPSIWVPIRSWSPILRPATAKL